VSGLPTRTDAPAPGLWEQWAPLRYTSLAGRGRGCDVTQPIYVMWTILHTVPILLFTSFYDFHLHSSTLCESAIHCAFSSVLWTAQQSPRISTCLRLSTLFYAMSSTPIFLYMMSTLLYIWLRQYMSTPITYSAQSTLFNFMWQPLQPHRLLSDNHICTFILYFPSMLSVCAKWLLLFLQLQEVCTLLCRNALPVCQFLSMSAPTCGWISTSTASQVPTQALMAEMCAWQPFTLQTETTKLLLRLHEHSSQTEFAPMVYIYIFREHFQCSEDIFS
jgi:hypothetical protein